MDQERLFDFQFSWLSKYDTTFPSEVCSCQLHLKYQNKMILFSVEGGICLLRNAFQIIHSIFDHCQAIPSTVILGLSRQKYCKQ